MENFKIRPENASGKGEKGEKTPNSPRNFEQPHNDHSPILIILLILRLVNSNLPFSFCFLQIITKPKENGKKMTRRKSLRKINGGEIIAFSRFDLSVCSNNPSVSHSLDSSLYTRELHLKG